MLFWKSKDRGLLVTTITLQKNLMQKGNFRSKNNNLVQAKFVDIVLKTTTTKYINQMLILFFIGG